MGLVLDYVQEAECPLDEDLKSWPERRAAKGAVRALTEDFPETTRRDPRLFAALAQLRSAEASVEAVFRELVERGNRS